MGFSLGLQLAMTLAVEGDLAMEQMRPEGDKSDRRSTVNVRVSGEDLLYHNFMVNIDRRNSFITVPTSCIRRYNA